MYEKQLIAAMNNFEAVQAWKAARKEGGWRVHNYDRARHYEKVLQSCQTDLITTRARIKALQKELCASREESCALHEELGEVYEMYTWRGRTLYRLEEKNYWLQRRVQSATEVVLGTWGLCGIGFWAQVLLILP